MKIKSNFTERTNLCSKILLTLFTLIIAYSSILGQGPTADFYGNGSGTVIRANSDGSSHANEYIYFKTGESRNGEWFSNPNMVITNNRIGIGHLNPESMLHLKGAQAAITIENPNGGNPTLRFKTNSYPTGYDIFADAQGNWGVYDQRVSSNRLLIDQNGKTTIAGDVSLLSKLGIGIGTPAASLHVNSGVSGGILLETQSGNPTMSFKTATNNKDFSIFTEPVNGTFNIYDGQSSKYRFVINPTGIVGIGGDVALGSKLGVGFPINALDPKAQLHVKSPVNGGLVVETTTGNPSLMLKSSTANRNYEVFADNIGRFGIYDGVANRSSFLISKDGNVGIGIDAAGVEPIPSRLLEVGRDNATTTNTLMQVHGGAIFNNDADQTHLTRIAINTNTAVAGSALTVGGPTYIGSWGDAENQINASYLSKYFLWVKKGVVSEDFAVASAPQWKDEVFKDDYKLPTLGEVEKYIQENKHLPGIPSEKEVKENGYSLHELNKSFLEKIEHLVLYSIQQNKKIDELETQLNELKAALKK